MLKQRAKFKGRKDAIKVPTKYKNQRTAYALGYWHGDKKAKCCTRKDFVYEVSFTAYCLGFTAGTIARAARLGLVLLTIFLACASGALGQSPEPINCTVFEVLSGNEIACWLPVETRATRREYTTARIAGIETQQASGKLATEVANQARLALERLVAGQSVRVRVLGGEAIWLYDETPIQTELKPGWRWRWRLIVTLNLLSLNIDDEREGHDVAERMLRTGWVWLPRLFETEITDHDQAKTYRAAEVSAKFAQAGIWQYGIFGPLAIERGADPKPFLPKRRNQ